MLQGVFIINTSTGEVFGDLVLLRETVSLCVSVLMRDVVHFTHQRTAPSKAPPVVNAQHQQRHHSVKTVSYQGQAAAGVNAAS